MTPLKFENEEDRTERREKSRAEHSRLQIELQTIEELMHTLFDQHISELNKEAPDDKMVEQMETQIENV